jgi:hypothetical protein
MSEEQGGTSKDFVPACSSLVPYSLKQKSLERIEAFLV